MKEFEQIPPHDEFRKDYWRNKEQAWSQSSGEPLRKIYYDGIRKEVLDKLENIEPRKLELDCYDITDELIELLLSKHEDYGPKNISDSPGGAINGLRVRMHDKLARINNLFDNAQEGTPQHESFEDSFKDMANYAIIGLLVLRGKWDN